MFQQNSAPPEATHQDSEPTQEHPEMIHIGTLPSGAGFGEPLTSRTRMYAVIVDCCRVAVAREVQAGQSPILHQHVLARLHILHSSSEIEITSNQ